MCAEYSHLEGDTRCGLTVSRTTSLIATNPRYNSLKDYPNLTEVDVSDNTSITNVTYLKKLVKLAARGKSALTSKGIKGLRLTSLDITNNPNITSVPESLTELIASGSRCGLGSVASLQLLTKLTIDHNQLIVTLPPLPHLVELSARNTRLAPDALTSLPKLAKLDLSGCQTITDVSHLTSVTHVDISDSSIDQAGIEGLNLIYLNCSYNSGVLDLSSFTTIEHLVADGDTLTQEGLPPNVKTLSIEDNPNIVSVKHLTQLSQLDGDSDIVEAWLNI